MKLEDRIRGALLGHLVGDALGTPYEFNKRFKGGGVPPIDQIEMNPPEGYNRSHEQVPVGTWSDDGANTLCLLETYLTCGSLDMTYLGHLLTKWLSFGHNTPDGVMFGSGGVTRQSLNRVLSGIPAEQAGMCGEEHNGNGALMRALPVALWHTDSLKVCQDAMRQSKVTHGHLKSQLCCAIYCSWILNLLDEDLVDSELPLLDFSLPLLELKVNLEHEDFLEAKTCVDEIEAFDDPQGTSYVVDCLHSARKVVEENSTYEDTVRAAIAMGNDTDTTAAVAGSMAGALYGIDGIPKRWLNLLKGRDIVDPMLEKLIGKRK